MKPGFYWIAKALLSHYWRHPWQTVFLSVGLMAGVALWSAVQIINQQAESSYQQAQNLLGAQASYWVQSRNDAGIDQALYIDLRRQGFRQIFPVVELQVSTADGKSVSLIATDLIALPGYDMNDEQSLGDAGASWLEFIQPPYRAWFPAVLADELGLQAGDRLRLRDGRELPPALIQSRERQGRRVLIDIGAAFALSGLSNFSYLAVGDLSPDQFQQLSATLPEHLELIENQQHIDLGALTASLHTHLTAMSLLSFAVGLFIVFNAVRFSLWHRRRTLLDLRLMGCDTRWLIGAIFLETLCWSLIGTTAGFSLGVLLAHSLLPGLGASMQSLYQATIDVSLNPDPKTLLQAWSMTFAGLTVALAWPLYQQLKYASFVASSSETIVADETVTRRRLGLASIGLALIAWFYYGRITTPAEGFVLLGLILFAAAWILPVLLAASLRLLTWLVPGRLLLTRWMIGDGWSQLPAFRSAMMALLLALTANLGVGTLVDSFRDAFTGWLGQRQSADIYLRVPGFDYQRLVREGEAGQWLVDSHQRIGVSSRWQGRPSLVRGADTSAPDSLAFPLSKWQGESVDKALQTWREQPGSILINEQVHFLVGIDVGEAIELETDQGVQNFEVVGVFYDYGNPYFQFYLPEHVVKQHWQHYYSRGIALWLNKEYEGAMEAAEQALIANGARPGDWISQAQIRSLSIGIFDRTFAITAAMNLLTLIVAAIALMASLLAILQERIPQFAQWRALGLRQRELLLLIATPLLIFCAVVWLMSIPLGALLSWILIDKLNIISFGWSMPLVWRFEPAFDLAAVILAIIVFALLLVSLQWRRQKSSALAQLGEMV